MVNDLVGKKFNSLTVIKRIENNKYGKAQFICKCDCGNYTKGISSEIKSGHKKSCGCAQIKYATKHNLNNSHEYQTYHDMLQRCYNEKNKYYERYGGRGIEVCDRWRDKEKGFINFYEDMGRRENNKLSLDRVDNDKGYSPENCEWRTKKQQARNTSSNKIITYKGISKCVTEWSEELGIHRCTIQYRLRSGWSVDKIIETPVKELHKYLYDVEYRTAKEISDLCGFPSRTIGDRLRKGWSLEEATTTKFRGRRNIYTNK